MASFKTENLSFTYPQINKKALDGVSLNISDGEFIVVMGKTGSGKSTLLKLLKKDLAPFGNIEGSIDVSSSNIGFVPQNPDVTFVAQTVRSELAFALENMKMAGSDITVRIGEIASFFNLSDMLDRNISELSGGERATVAIAGAMICDADALILDEPLAQLDPKATSQIISLLKRVNSELGVTVLISSHTSQGLADICDRIIIMDGGRIIFNESPDKIKYDDSSLDYLPVYTALFPERPLTIKEAILLAENLKEKPLLMPEKSDIAVRVKNITFAYGKKERDILSNLSFKAYKGRVHAIIGANGSGKTTFLKVAAGIKKPLTGSVKVSGKIAYLPQDPRFLFTSDTVGEEIDAKAAEVFGLNEYLDSHPYDLSGGQMQKLALAMLSQTKFDVLLLDEPSRSLDVFAKRELKQYLKELALKGKTIIMVSHDLDFVGDTADYVSFLSDGVISVSGERRRVLSLLKFYTTQIRRITKSCLDSAVSVEDLQ